jgi:hypothetical protein
MSWEGFGGRFGIIRWGSGWTGWILVWGGRARFGLGLAGRGLGCRSALLVIVGAVVELGFGIRRF